MATRLARRDLLRGRLKPPPDKLRPPFAIAETDFLRLCRNCADCAKACPQGVIRLSDDGTPVLAFQLGECSFCGDCLTACRSGALDREKAREWHICAEITSSCLSLNAVTCRSCGDNCEQEAITFRLMTMGRAQPVVDSTLCNGCGACVRVCPSRSVRVAREQGRGQAHPWLETDAA